MSIYTKRINLLRVTVVNIYHTDILENSLKFQVVNNIYVVILYIIILATQIIEQSVQISSCNAHLMTKRYFFSSLPSQRLRSSPKKSCPELACTLKSINQSAAVTVLNCVHQTCAALDK